VRVAVLHGGRSSEHSVSLASAEAAIGGVAAAGHEAVPVLLERGGAWRGPDGEPLALVPGGGLLGAAVAFPVLHGPFGEDGTVQGLLELLDVAYVGSGVLSSALCMDKVLFKEVMARAGLPQVGFVSVEEGVLDGAASRIEALGLPCWVKPARLGSSVGIVRVGSPREVEGALQTAFAHDPRVIVEASATGLEVECSVLGPTSAPEASTPGEIVLLKGEGWYDYEAKYAEGGMELVVPPRISSVAVSRVQSLAVEAFRLAGCSGLARADFFVDGDEVLLNELNTMPGFTATSVYAKLWAASGLAYPALVDRLVTIAAERFRDERRHRF
jgi:D-alanine-D-alanine ligase